MMRPKEPIAEGSAIRDSDDMHARISVLEQQIIDQKEATVIALAAADKAIVNAVVVADKAVAKVELAAEKTYLEAAIASLKEAFNNQIDHQKELTAQALASADKAVQKAEVAAEKRFESVNEFRSTLADQQSGLATKIEVNLRFIALEDRLNNLVADAREVKGRSVGGRETATDNRALLFSMIAAAGAIAAVIIAFLPHFTR